MASTHTRTTSRKQERLEARVSPEQKSMLQRAAELKGLTLSDFVVTSAAQAATQTIQEHTSLVLSERESFAFAEALLRVEPAGPRLQQAAARYRAAIG
jgi:uncharacterized protein (DUF1778 family)